MTDLLRFKFVLWRLPFWLAFARLCLNLRWRRGADYAIVRVGRLYAVQQRMRQVQFFRNRS